MHHAVKHTFYFDLCYEYMLPLTGIAISKVEKHTLFSRILVFLTPFSVNAHTSNVGKKQPFLLVFLYEHHPPLNTSAPGAKFEE